VVVFYNYLKTLGEFHYFGSAPPAAPPSSSLLLLLSYLDLRDMVVAKVLVSSWCSTLVVLRNGFLRPCLVPKIFAK
jgi:hypothetical protein